MSTLKYVLDHGFVRLVSFMQPVPTEIREFYSIDLKTGEVVGYQRPANWTGDLEIVRNARVSFDADWRGEAADIIDSDINAGKGIPPEKSRDGKLINYMMTNHHSSPFEAMTFTFEVKAPIFVFRQWHRHRTWSYNELSARYAPMQEEFYNPDPAHIGVQSTSNRQGRELTLDQNADRQAVQLKMDETNHAAFEAYRLMLKNGVPRELARSVLPVSTYSRMFATVDLHNLFHFLRLRLHAHAQYEIRVYAEALLELIEPICPLAVKSFKATLVA